MAEEAKWYVVHTYSGYENKVKANIEKSVDNRGIQDLIQNVEVPLEDVVEEKSDGTEKIVKRKVFPGYVVIKMVMNDESWFVVRNTPNVTGFVGSHGGGSKPSPLYEEEVRAILQMQEGEATEKVDYDYEVGESVMITAGAFNGMVGKIAEIQEDKQKLFLTIDMFGHATTAELGFDQVKKMED